MYPIHNSIFDQLLQNLIFQVGEMEQQEQDLDTSFSAQQRDLQEKLDLAVQVDDHVAVQYLVAAGADVNLTAPFSLMTYLDQAVIYGHVQTVKILLAAGADVNMGAALLSDAHVGCLEVVQELVVAGADVNMDDGRVTPLILALRLDRVLVAQFLIAAGADVNKSLCKQETALGLAVERNKYALVDQLMQAGADVNLLGKEKDATLHWAIGAQYKRLASALISSGADVNYIGKYACRNLELAIKLKDDGMAMQLVKAGADVNTRAIGGESPMYLASEQQSKALVEAMLDAGADPDSCNGQQRRVLHQAATFAGWDDIVKKLIAAGADVNAQSQASSTPLLKAVWSENFASARALLAAGADANIANELNVTPLLAALCKKIPVQFLLDGGANVNNTMDDLIVWKIALTAGNIDNVKSLLGHGINIPNEVCHFPADIKDEVAMATLFFAAGFDIKVRLWNSTRSDESRRFLSAMMTLAQEAERPAYFDGTRVFPQNPPSLIGGARNHIRKYLMDLSRENLFCRVPRLGLPPIMQKFLLFDQTLDPMTSASDNSTSGSSDHTYALQ